MIALWISSIVASSIRKLAVCAVTSAGVSRMNDANDANTHLRSIGLPLFPCLTGITQGPAVVERDSSSVLRAGADRDRLARQKGAVLSPARSAARPSISS